MIYKTFQGLKLSALGMGAMRLPKLDENDANIDVEQTKKMVAYAMENGVNYYDTAYAYHFGQSENVMGKVLRQYPRDSFYLADKFPGYDLSNMGKVEAIFEEQLKKCQVDYFDFYLFHNVCELNIDAYLDPQNGILDYLLKQKERGRIRHLGFSAHGSYEVIERFLKANGQHMEFAQIQLNYIDWSFQDAKGKIDLLSQYQLPVWVMEPFRGGQLASLAEADEEKLKALRPDEKIPAWAFRFLLSIPEVKMILTGASSFDQLKENIGTFSEEKALSEKEETALLSIADEMVKKIALPCTACGYCLSHCPQQLEIPKLLNLYNEHFFTGGGFIAPFALMAMGKDKQPSACIGCKQCEEVCPQQIKISEAMTDFTEKLKQGPF
jgi:predicted aldo/keto reductase-like oxidoreductase